jgi:hypothetical protein
MREYKVTVEAEQRNIGHRMYIEGLPHLLNRDRDPKYQRPEYECDHNECWRQYNYDKTVPPFWAIGIAESRCFTLPFAVYIALYDLVQVHDAIKNGDQFVFEYEGIEYVTIVDSAWPTCEKACELERNFRKEMGVDYWTGLSKKEMRGD